MSANEDVGSQRRVDFEIPPRFERGIKHSYKGMEREMSAREDKKCEL